MYSKILSAFLVVNFFLQCSCHTWDSKDYFYIAETTSFYKNHPEAKTWYDALVTCELEGASLFYPVDEKEVNSLKKLSKLSSHTFVGFSDLYSEGQFRAIDGVLINNVYYNKWAGGQPDNWQEVGGEDCVAIERNGDLNDVACNKKLPFICRKSLTSLTHSCASQPWNPKDYIYVAETQSFYNIHVSNNTWEEAVKTCVSEGTSLFYPENDKEAELVQKWRTQYRNVLPKCHSDFIFIGLSDISSEGNFVTVDGRPVNSVFNKWAPGQPDNWQAVGGEDCAVMNCNNKLNDAGCSIQLPFVCKKSLASLQL